MLQFSNGLTFNEFSIDPHRSPKNKNVVFSHAHADHIKVSKTSNFFASQETIDIVKERNKRKYPVNFIPVEKELKFDNSKIIFHDNGHILGSKQMEVFSQKNYVITSDFRLNNSLLFKGAKPLSSEILVLETTFASPQYSFPKYDEVVSSMVSWIEKESKNSLVILSGYSLGKAQELTRISNESGITPLVHDSIFNINEIYKNHNVKVGDYIKLDHNINDSSVLIVPPQLVNNFLISALREVHKTDIKTALATGWPQARGFDITFPLSNHADYNDLISYVEQSNPKLVLTDHGFCEEFSRKLNRLGYNSKPLKQHNQKGLFEF